MVVRMQDCIDESAHVEYLIYVIKFSIKER